MEPRGLLNGPFRGPDAIAAGLLTPRQLHGSTWVRLLRGVYVHSSVTVDHRTLCEAAALLLPPGAAIAETSAALLWGAAINNPDKVTVYLPPGVKLGASAGLVVRRIRLADDETTSVLGPVVTTPLRTAFDIAHRCLLVDAVVALDAMLHKRVIYLDALLDHLNRRAGEFGVAAARKAIALADPLAESAMETRLRLVLLAGGLPRPVAQLKVFDGQRFVARLDFAYPDAMLAIEYDGDHHRDRITFRFDLERQNELRVLGWTVLRFTADDVLRFPGRTVAQVRVMLASRGS